MAGKKEEDTVWIGAPEAVEVLSRVNHRPIHPNYLSILGRNGRIARKQVDGRTYLYSKQDAEGIHIIERKGAGRKKREPLEEDTAKRPAVKIDEAA